MHITSVKGGLNAVDLTFPFFQLSQSNLCFLVALCHLVYLSFRNTPYFQRMPEVLDGNRLASKVIRIKTIVIKMYLMILF